MVTNYVLNLGNNTAFTTVGKLAHVHHFNTALKHSTPRRTHYFPRMLYSRPSNSAASQVQLQVQWHPPLTGSQQEHTLLLMLRIQPATFQLPLVLSTSFVHLLPAPSPVPLYCNYTK